jgi:pimeloyl-ACP methyl ester carboxylesterase
MACPWRTFELSLALELWYRETGEDSNPPLVMLHGLFASMQNWQSIAKRLVKDFHIFNTDLPNHGNSPRSDSVSYQEMVDAVIALLEKIGEPVHLLGHSMGGKVAMLVCLQRPELVQKLIIEDIAPKTYPQWFAPIVRALVNCPISGIKTRMEADELLKSEITDAALRTFLLTNLVRSEQGGFEWRVNLDALVRGGPSIAGFPDTDTQSNLPALWINGGQSEYVKKDDVECILEKFPKAKVEWMEEADHWVHARDPEHFAQRVREFLIST